MKQPIPVILSIYDHNQSEIYWRVIQEFVWDILSDRTPNWRSQQTVRIRIPRSQKITNYDRLETAVNRTQNRINRDKNRTLSIGEGVAFSPTDFTELEKQKENDRLQYRGHTLLLAKQQFESGDKDAARQSIAEIVNANYDDEATVKALFIQILMRNLADGEDAIEIVELANEAKSVAKDLDMDTDQQIATIYKHVGGLFVILEKRSEMLANDLFQSTIESDLLENKIIQESISHDLLVGELEAISEINSALSEMLDSNEYYAYAVCLSPIIDYLSHRRFLHINRQTMDFDKSPDEIETPKSIQTIEGISDQTHSIVEQAEQLADYITDRETEFNLRKSIGLYYYNSIKPEKADQFLTEAYNIVKNNENRRLSEDTKSILEDIKKRKNPYDYSTYDTSSDTNVTDLTKQALEMQGFDIDLESPPESNEYDDSLDYELDLMAHQAVTDADPEDYYRHCEHLHLAYNPSPVGERLGIVSFGSKYLWCQHGGLMNGLDLDETFERFHTTYCDGCEQHCPRSDDWELTEAYANEQANDPDFVKAMNQFENSLMPEYSRSSDNQ